MLSNSPEDGLKTILCVEVLRIEEIKIMIKDVTGPINESVNCIAKNLI